MYSKKITVVGNPIEKLYAKEYEDPRDAIYLTTLKLNKGFDKVIKFAMDYGIERMCLLQYTGSNVKVTESNMPYLFNCVKKACEILNVNEIPNTYIVQDPYMNAMTIGSKHPILVIHDSLLKRLNNEELMFIIGHEIGHIKSEHCQYHLIGEYLQMAMEYGTSYIPVIGPALSQILGTGLDYAYYDWSRKSEFTADHAGLLVCQDLKSAISAQAKLGGYPEEFYESLDIDGFLRQAQEFDDFEDKAFNKVLKFAMTLDMTHPWEVQRAKELMLWVQSGEYNRILMRSSKWLTDRLHLLEQRSDDAKDKHIKKDSIAKKVVHDISDEVDQSKGIKAIQAKIDQATAKKKMNNAEDAKEKMMEKFAQEKELRKLYQNISEEELENLVNKTIGNLRKIKEK